MYLKNISASFLKKIENDNASFPNFVKPLLEEGAYAIYFEYEVSSDAFFYSAIGVDEKKIKRNFAPLTLAIGVKKNGTLIGDPDPFNAAFLLYLCEYENSLSEEEISAIYSEEAEKISLTSGLSPEQAKEKIERRKDFESFLNKLDRAGKSKNQSKENKHEKYDVRVGLSHAYGRFAGSLSLITTSGTYPIANLYRFFEAFRAKGTYKLSGKEAIVVDPMNFRKPYDGILSSLSVSLLFYNKAKVESASIITASIPSLLYSLLGETFLYNDKRIKIEEDIPVSISLNKDGNPSFEPSFPTQQDETDKNRFFHEEGVFVLDDKRREIRFYRYESPLIKQTYLYFEQHRDHFSYIKDMFVSKLLPRLSASIKISNPKEGNKPSFAIRLYISFDEHRRLSFKTVYEENREEKKRLEIKGELGKSLAMGYLSLLESLGGKENGHIDKEEEIFAFLTADLTPLSRLASIYYEDRINPKNVRRVGALSISTRYENNLLEMKLNSESYDDETLSSLLKAKKEKKRFVLLKDKTILLDDPILDEAVEVFENGEIEIENAPVYRLFSLESSHFSLLADKRSREVLNAIKNYREKEVSLPPSLKEILRPYQKEGVSYLSTLSSFYLGGILADEMGLGKTVQAIAYLVSLEESMPVLILCPKAVVYNWDNEIKRFSSLDCQIIDGGKTRREEIIKGIKKDVKKVFVMGYDSFRRDCESFEEINFAACILDEAQSVKNAFSMRHQSLGRIHAQHRFALTGTPLENSPSDLWSIFHFLMPGYLGSLDKFNKLGLDKASLDHLSSLLKPFTLRRKKEDVLKDLPPKTETNILVSMDEEQKMLYAAYLKKAREEESHLEGGKITILAALTRLRQICVDPSSFLEEYEAVSSKLSYCRDMISELKENGHKVLVFSSFKTVLHHLADLLESADINAAMITGDTSGKERQVLAKSFNEDNSDLDAMLVSLKAGGVGMNLTGADMVIHLDPWWNPASENQASDRAHRIGQTRPVTIFRLIAKDSIEEKIQELQERKKDLFDNLVEDSGGASKLTDEDIRFLLY